jgi:hypothetical protein
MLFISKPWKVKYTEVKAYCPISPLSFMLKVMEELVDWHIREKILGLSPLRHYQFGYQPGKSTETALHHVIAHSHTCRRNSEGDCWQELSAGGILSLLLWSLVVDELVGELSGNGYYTLGYADDIAILIRRTFLNTVSELLC